MAATAAGSPTDSGRTYCRLRSPGASATNVNTMRVMPKKTGMLMRSRRMMKVVTVPVQGAGDDEGGAFEAPPSSGPSRRALLALGPGLGGVVVRATAGGRR